MNETVERAGWLLTVALSLVLALAVVARPALMTAETEKQTLIELVSK